MSLEGLNITLVKKEEFTIPQKGTGRKHSTKYNRAEMVAAILYMSSMYGWTLEPADLPRKYLAEVFGVSTVTIARVMRELKKGRNLAISAGEKMIKLKEE